MKAIRKAKLGEQPKDNKETRTSQTSLNRSNSSTVNPNPESSEGGNVDWLPPKTQLKPADQLQLTDTELDEEFTRILNANNPHAPHNIARYNNKERTYKSSKDIEHLVIHFDFEGYLLYKGGDEKEEVNKATDSEEKSELFEENDQKDTTLEGETQVQENTKKLAKAPVKNQFNFSERATQTFNNPFRNRSTNTEPPPHRTFSAAVNQWSIYDAYLEDKLAKEKAAKDKTKGSANVKVQKEEEKKAVLAADSHIDDIYRRPTLKKSLAVIERMANQNTYDEVAQDFKYWEDAADEFRENKEGSLLPLWKFAYEKERKKQVTALSWNPKCGDLFAVGYGSYEFSKQGPGLICCFSLKNPSYPEYIFSTESGVMCLDFHPKRAHLIAAGLYDGTTLVYDLHSKSNIPLFKSSSKSGKHTDPVWQVNWQSDDLDGNPNFYAISSDGRVSQWTLLKNELVCTDVIKLRHETALQSDDKDATKDDQKLFQLLAGTCFDFNKGNDNIFIVGTEEGKMFKCSKAYNSQYLLSFDGHFMGTYAISYNRFCTNVFLSSSGDWTVKLWDHDNSKPIMVFDLNSPISDVAWAPYSATVFAAVTAEGKVCIFDLEVNKYEPICEQQVARKAKLTHISFNSFEPIVIVGDDKGNIISLKLSPNLRRVGRGGQKLTGEEQKERLEKIILLATGKNVDAVR
ncbi:WD40-repeat-containing domain protein [Paraphysoderma sedebokerense]|nr:WD40-repeat-containing domain protein [Paraphysoderma sedebokerense]